MQDYPRKVFIGGNWKCNGDKTFVNAHSMFLNGIQFDTNKCEVAVCPVFIHLLPIQTFLNKKIHICAQNI